mmetsp:Transcript_12000/g.18292  ORF Transcript_12000/g.18292 Transcript_12000/m.18292 type:complete len:267 (-) Transcript_12000:255-1055(-)
MKKSNYVTMIISTYGMLICFADTKDCTWIENNRKSLKSFRYPEVIHNHLKYCHIIEDHSAKQHSMISLKMLWTTKWLPNRVFSFLLATAEINIYTAFTYFLNEEDRGETTIDKQKQFVKELHYNPYCCGAISDSTTRSAITSSHVFCSIPLYRKYSANILTYSNTAYPQRLCYRCNKNCRFYCSCTPGVYHCKQCFAAHCVHEKMYLQRGTELRQLKIFLYTRCPIKNSSLTISLSHLPLTSLESSFINLSSDTSNAFVISFFKAF